MQAYRGNMSRITVAFALLCALCCCISSLAFEIEDCGSLGTLDEISFSSCSLSDEKCFFPRGSDVSAAVKFTPASDVSEVETRIFGILLDVPIPFPLEQPNICKDSKSGLKCPLKGGKQYEYKTTLAVPKTTPSLSLEVMLQFVSPGGIQLGCIKFPAKLT